MKGTSEDLKQAILTLADFCEVGNGYRKRLEFEGFASPEMVKDIIAELFLCAFDPKDCSKELYEAYMTVYEYYVELRSYGYVKFGN